MGQFERFFGLKNQHFFSELVENLRYAFKNYGSDTKSTQRHDQVEIFIFFKSILIISKVLQ